MKPKTLIAASCAACLLVLVTPGVISRDEVDAVAPDREGPPEPRPDEDAPRRLRLPLLGTPAWFSFELLPERVGR